MSVGYDPLEDSTRRLVSTMIWYIERDLDDDKREQFRNTLQGKKTPTFKKPQRNPVTGKKFVPAKSAKWKAPEGWRPPGWDEEKSYKQSMAFMGFQANPK